MMMDEDEDDKNDTDDEDSDGAMTTLATRIILEADNCGSDWSKNHPKSQVFSEDIYSTTNL